MIREVLTTALIVVGILVIATAWQLYESCERASKEPGDDTTVSVARIGWSADGRNLLALYRGDLGEAGPLVLYDVGDSPRSRPLRAGPKLISAETLLPDSAAILAADEAARVWRIDVHSTERLQVAALPSGTLCSAIAAGPDGRTFALGASDGSLLVGEAPVLIAEAASPAHRGAISSLEFSRDGRRLVSSSMDGSVKVWDADTRCLIAALMGHIGPATGVSFVPGGRHVLSCGRDDTLRLWEIESAREVWQSAGPGAPGALCIDVSADGAVAACGGYGTVCLVDLASRQNLPPITEHSEAVTTLEFSPDGLYLATGSLDGKIGLWEVANWSLADWIGHPAHNNDSRRAR